MTRLKIFSRVSSFILLASSCASSPSSQTQYAPLTSDTATNQSVQTKTSSADPPTAAVSKPEADETTSVERRDEELFERLCATEQLKGCEQLKAARKARADKQRLVKEYIDLYRPTVAKLAGLLVVPVRAPDARVDASATVNTKQPDGPQMVQVEVEVDYRNGLERHPNTNMIRATFTSLKELNNIMNAKGAYPSEVTTIIRSQMVELKLKTLAKTITVLVPAKDTGLILNARILNGTVNYALVTSIPGLKYLVVKEWTKPMYAALKIAQSMPEGAVVIEEAKPTRQKHISIYNVPSKALCDNLRAEVRLSVSGKPQRKWNPRAIK